MTRSSSAVTTSARSASGSPFTRTLFHFSNKNCATHAEFKGVLHSFCSIIQCGFLSSPSQEHSRSTKKRFEILRRTGNSVARSRFATDDRSLEDGSVRRPVMNA